MFCSVQITNAVQKKIFGLILVTKAALVQYEDEYCKLLRFALSRYPREWIYAF